MQIYCSCSRISRHWVLRVNPPRPTFLHKYKDSITLIIYVQTIISIATIYSHFCINTRTQQL